MRTDASPTPSQRNPLKAIRRHCINCSGGSPRAVEECPCSECALFSFRMGVNPFRKGASQKSISSILGQNTPLGDASESTSDKEVGDGA